MIILIMIIIKIMILSIIIITKIITIINNNSNKNNKTKKGHELLCACLFRCWSKFQKEKSDVSATQPKKESESSYNIAMKKKKNVCWLNIKVKIAHEQTIAKPLPNKKSLKVTFLKTKDGIQVTSWALPLHVDICSIECISAMAISVITIIYYLFSTYRENDYFKTFSAVFDKHSLDSNNFLNIY